MDATRSPTAEAHETTRLLRVEPEVLDGDVDKGTESSDDYQKKTDQRLTDFLVFDRQVVYIYTHYIIGIERQNLNVQTNILLFKNPLNENCVRILCEKHTF